MKIKYLLITILGLSVFVSCNTNTNRQETTEENKESAVSVKNIPFNVAKNYFVKNNVIDDFLTLKISTQEDFDKYFGIAATMSQNGKPTPIDFSEGYIIAIIDKNSNKSTTITPESLIRNGEKIDFTYTLKEGAEQTFTSRTELILIVNNEYTGEINFIKQ